MTAEHPGDLQIEGLSVLLSAIEIREVEILGWGAHDARFSRSELEQLVREQDPNLDGSTTVSQLLRHGLVFEVPGGGYRSRMAETVRVLATLRQTFSTRAWWASPELVLDHRLLHRPRRRPTRDRGAQELIDIGSQGYGSAGRSALEALTPPFVSAFQVRSTSSIRISLNSNRDSGVVVAAGTGSGKTLAFYLPVIAHVVETIDSGKALGVQVLALYPRNELLKDQLRTALQLSRTLESKGLPLAGRPLRLGAWIGTVPNSASRVKEPTSGWTRVGTREQPTGWRCPFVTCPECEQGLIWKRLDVDSGRERLECESDSCGVIVDGSQLALTRESAQKKPPDVMFTTTESLNRQLAAPNRFPAFGLGETSTTRIVLLDEVHTYEGISGAQCAFLFRRLRNAISGPILWCGLSATLLHAQGFLAELTGIPQETVTVVEPDDSELEESGAEYLLALRHNPASKTGPLSTSIQTAMALERSLDCPEQESNPFAPQSMSSKGMFGSRTFVFTDKLDVTNRLYWDLMSAEGRYSEHTLIKGRIPGTLAHLRSTHQNRLGEAHRDDASSREDPGQWWWMAEAIGWPIEADTPLRVGRTSSQDQGVSDADVIVATASLEIGYDDPHAGAVIQHRAPHDAARFLQRKGRAGRSMTMRPWTVVVLSGWGRDAMSWQGYDQLFDPQLSAPRLPLANRYVQRMQAVYAFLDWIGREGSKLHLKLQGWNVLLEPRSSSSFGENDRVRIERLLEEVLHGGPARSRLTRHLMQALNLRREEVEALLWTPPRPLLLAVIPTAHRRLLNRWEGERANADDRSPATWTPLREFIAGNLFSDLLTPDVLVDVPTGRRNQDARVVETLPILRVLREFLPGNVTRHFGIRADGRRHWVELPTGPTIDVATYGGSYLRTVERSDGPVRVYMPTEVRLDFPPDQVKDSSSVSPLWDVDLEAIGGGSLIPPPRDWSDVLDGICFHLHAEADGVRINRFTARVGGSLRVGSDRIAVDFGFADGGSVGSAAIGSEFDADAFVVQAQIPTRSFKVTPIDRTLQLRSGVTSDPSFAGLDWASKNSLASALLVVVAEIGGAEPAACLSDREMVEAIDSALERLDLISAKPGDADSGNPSPDRQLEVSEVIRDPSMLAGLRRALEIANAPQDDPQWRHWHAGRFAAAVADVLLQAAGSIEESFDAAEIAVDIEIIETETQSLQAKIWCSEVSPGGNGLIEALYVKVLERPGIFWRLVREATSPNDLERLDSSLLTVIGDDSSELELAIDKLRNSWSTGHGEARVAIEQLRDCLESRTGVAPERNVISYLSTRIGAPGAPAELRSAIKELVDMWREVEASSSFALDARSIGALSVVRKFENPALQSLITATPPPRRARLLASLLWPRSLDVVEGREAPGQHFGDLQSPEMELIRPVFPPPWPVVAVSENDASQLAAETLNNQFSMTLEFTSRRDAKISMLRLLDTSVEVADLLVHPRLVGMRNEGKNTYVDLTVNEADI